MKPEPLKVETLTETRTTTVVVVAGKWIFPVEQKVVVVKYQRYRHQS